MKNNTIAIASDHRGYKLKQNLIKWLEKNDYDIIDFGTSSEKRVDYPDYTKNLCEWMKSNPKGRGIVICGNGIGQSIFSNRFKHIRAALLYSKKVARDARIHNDTNVAVLGAESFRFSKQKKMLEIFFKTEKSPDPKYKRCIKKIS
ncbi:MAG: RpiB/LacA/LacB family sugar-phosphate isomerase [Alphaproteobacteria bacterium]|jgi:ribose 5-phosphate isomerase B|nr:RpiB/LacA/LacB family sugar-phosphate isomerase [Alphaproteobacteria bacterium]